MAVATWCPRPVLLRPARGAAPSGTNVALLLDLIQRAGQALHRSVDVRPLIEAEQANAEGGQALWLDRKSTRLNSSH